MAEDTAQRKATATRKVTHIAMEPDERKQVFVILAVCDDGSMWLGRGEDDWEEIESVPGTKRRQEQKE